MIEQARKYAVWALEGHLIQASKEAGFGSSNKLHVLKTRIAKIKAGNGDGLPEVQSAMYALKALVRG